MIPRRYIQEWASCAPWQEPRQIEQDLIITNALIKIYNHPLLRASLAFRGGTALNKLFFKPASRYSEDIDLVQITAEPIGPILDALRSVMTPWMGTPKWSSSEGRVTLIYRVMSDDGFPLKLKLEINSREHFTVLGFEDYDFSTTSSWIEESTIIRAFQIEELLGTKLRALYQRRKGRDLYDLYVALTTLDNLDVNKLIRCFHQYMHFEDHQVSGKQFEANMAQKLQNKEFRLDIAPLLPQGKAEFDPDVAYAHVYAQLLSKL